MNYRKYIVRVIGLLLAMLMLVGSIRPVAAQPTEISEIDINTILYDKLTEEDKMAIISELNLGIPLTEFKRIEFLGKLVASPIQLEGDRSDTCVKDSPGAEFDWDFGGSKYFTWKDEGEDEPRTFIEKYIEVPCDNPLIIQSLFAENCGCYEEMAHLTVTRAKDATYEIHAEELFSSDSTLNIESSGTLGPVTTTLGLSQSFGVQYAQGKSEVFTSSTSWEQSIDVIVPPRQRLDVDFVAFKKKITQEFTQDFTAMGEARPLIDSKDFAICFYKDANFGSSSQESPLCFNSLSAIKGNHLGPTRSISFGDLLHGWNDKIRSFKVKGDLRIEFYDAYNATGKEWWLCKEGLDSQGIPYWEGEGEEEEWWGIQDLNELAGLYENISGTISSIRIINHNEPYICLDGNYPSGATYPGTDTTRSYAGDYWVRCFNACESVDFQDLFNNVQKRVASVRHEATATVYDDWINAPQGDGEGSKSFFIDKSTYLTRFNEVSSIKVACPSTDDRGDTFSIERFIPENDRTFTIHGTYYNVDYAEGHFRRPVSTRLTREKCCAGLSDIASIDCTDENWANTMNSFVVYVKTRSPEGPGSGDIYQNGLWCGDDCTIAVPLQDLPVLWKLEAVSPPWLQFVGWQSETGDPLVGKHKPLPGDTIYAVFDLNPAYQTEVEVCVYDQPNYGGQQTCFKQSDQSDQMGNRYGVINFTSTSLGGPYGALNDKIRSFKINRQHARVEFFQAIADWKVWSYDDSDLEETGDGWRGLSSLPEDRRNEISSMRIIDTARPYACLVGNPRAIPGGPDDEYWEQCFNAGVHVDLGPDIYDGTTQFISLYNGATAIVYDLSIDDVNLHSGDKETFQEDVSGQKLDTLFNRGTSISVGW